MKNNTIFLIVGESGSGKTTIVNELEKRYGLKSIQSYTTRPQRSLSELGHIFIDDSQFNQLENMVAYTNFCGYEYCATQQQAEESDLYIIDPKGVEYFQEHYNGSKDVKVIYLTIDEDERERRMILRGDTEKSIDNRLANDYLEFQKVYDYADFCVININFNDTVELLADYIKQVNNHECYINKEEMRGFVNGSN